LGYILWFCSLFIFIDNFPFSVYNQKRMQ